MCVRLCVCLICLPAYCCIVYLFSNAFCLLEKLTERPHSCVSIWERVCVCASVCVHCFTLERAGKSQKQNGNENENENETVRRRMGMKMRWKRQAKGIASPRTHTRGVGRGAGRGGVANNKRDKIISPNLSHSRQQDQVKLYVCNGSSLFISLPQLLETWKQTILRIRSVVHSSQSLECGNTTETKPSTMFPLPSLSLSPTTAWWSVI